jgi:hypothetical protein
MNHADQEIRGINSNGCTTHAGGVLDHYASAEREH